MPTHEGTPTHNEYEKQLDVQLANGIQTCAEAAVYGVQQGMLDTEDGRKKLAELLTLPLKPVWGKAPERAKCTACGATGLERSFVMAGGPFAGSVRCPMCGHAESVYTHVAKTAITIEPL